MPVSSYGRPKVAKPKLKQVSSRLDADLVMALEVACEASGKTKADIIREALTPHLAITLASLIRGQDVRAERP